MGGVELLSREGEIAIAKRIEAGKDVMLNALSQSPITAQQFFEWDDKLQNDEILVREIIDIDTNYMDDDDNSNNQNKKNKMMIKTQMKVIIMKKMNLIQHLQLWKLKLNQKFLQTVHNLTKEYNKLIKYQKEKLRMCFKFKKLSSSKEKNYKKIVDDILENIKSLQLSPSVLEELVQKHYSENKKIVSLRR